MRRQMVAMREEGEREEEERGRVDEYQLALIDLEGQVNSAHSTVEQYRTFLVVSDHTHSRILVYILTTPIMPLP